MDDISLGVPEPLVDSLPEDGSGAAQDMHRAVEGYEQRINDLVADAEDDSEAAGEEPLVFNASDSDAAAAYRQLADSLTRVFFDGAAGTDLDQVFDESWFVDEEREEEGDDDEDGGVFGGLFG